MTPYDDIPLSKNDRLILSVLSNYLLAIHDRVRAKNQVPDSEVEISQDDAHELADALAVLLRDKAFIEKVKFSEAIVRPNALKRKSLRDTFIMRERYSKAMGREERFAAWEQFYFDFGNMPFQEFLSLESTLFEAADLHPKVSSLLLRLLDEHRKYVDDPRSMSNLSRTGSTGRRLEAVRKSLKKPTDLFGVGATLSTFDIAAIGTIVCNTSAMWLSKDWSTAGTISTLGGAALAARSRK